MTGVINRRGDPGAIAADLKMTLAGSPGLVAITTLPDRRTVFFPTTEIDAMVPYSTTTSTMSNVYVQVCTLATRPARGRGGEDDAIALPGLILDLDIAGPGHADVAGRLPLPADRTEALAIVTAMPVAPSMVVDTGHGLLVHYLFDHPMVMSTDTERTEAKALSARWNAHAGKLGKDRGIHVDNVSDLARLRRVAGTWNHKVPPPVPVVVLECHPERRYRPADLANALPAIPEPESPPRPARGAIRVLRPDGRESPAAAFSRCMSWEAILEPAGFTVMATRGQVTYWRHPEASSPAGTPSATTGARDRDVVVVHSESAAADTKLPVGPGHKLTRFRAWAWLHYGGDESAAARALCEMARKAS